MQLYRSLLDTLWIAKDSSLFGWTANWSDWVDQQADLSVLHMYVTKYHIYPTYWDK